MSFIVAPDSFKGSMSSRQVIDCCKKVLNLHFPTKKVIGIPIADGGEGTIDAFVGTLNGHKKLVKVRNPIGQIINSEYGVFDDIAVIEMANCSGLTLIDKKDLNPGLTSSYGTGQMIKQVIEDGFKKILIGIGGSATNDGGAGALEALGVRFIDLHHNIIENINGYKLGQVAYIDASQISPLIEDVTITVMCDVKNPLTGSNGATYVYGPQKGGSKEICDLLEANMLHYHKHVSDYFCLDFNDMPGAGAAGGMGYALKTFLNAELKRGIDVILDTCNFNTFLKGTSLVITGEGRLDGQSIQGKVIDGITNRTKKNHVPVLVITGGVEAGYETVLENGVDAVVTLPNKPMSLDDSINNGIILLEEQLNHLCRILKIGQSINLS